MLALCVDRLNKPIIDNGANVPPISSVHLLASDTSDNRPGPAINPIT